MWVEAPDLRRAAGELAECLPAPLAPLATRGLQLPLELGSGRPRRVRLRGRRALGALRAQPGAAASGGSRALAEAGRRGRRTWWNVLAALESRLRADLERPDADGPVEPAAAGGVLLRGVRHPQLAARLLRRARRPRGRHGEGGLRSRPAVRRRGADVPPGLLPPAHRRLGLAARVLGRHGSRPAARGAGQRGRRAAAPGQRAGGGGRGAARASGAWTWAGCRSTCSTPTMRRNDAAARWISSRLYVGDPGTRLAQYIVLGVGGVRVLRALGIEPGTLHLNEGHAALAPVELARADVAAGASPSDALAAAAARTVFTTHTPVPAGNDSYPAGQVEAAIAGLAGELGMPASELIRLGRTNPDDPHEPVGVTQLALRLSRSAGAVSRRHGEVAREMWHGLWPQRTVDEVPIGHVTNGVHVPTWVGAPMRELLDRHLGDGWRERADDPASWAGVDAIPDDELWAARSEQRGELVRFASERSVGDRLGRDDLPQYVEAAARTFDPGVLTLGFARRVATYKRLGLLTHDPERTLSPARRRASRAGGARRQGPPARRGGQAGAAGAVPAEGGAGGGRAGDLPRRLRPGHGGAPGAGLRRVGEPAAAAARGQRHERHEVGDERRAAAERAGRLVGRGRGPRAWLVAAGRHRGRSRRPGCARCRRALSPARGRGGARLLRARRGRPPRRLARPRARLAAPARARVLRHAHAARLRGARVPAGPPGSA